MRRILIFICYFNVILYAETTISIDSLFSMGNRYFNIEKYDYALDAYLAILDQVEHPDLYYNIGNTYYRLGDIGQAIWAYEKGIQLSPLNKDLQYNLDFLNARVKDRIEVPKNMLFIEIYRTLKRNIKLKDLLLWGGLMLLLSAFATLFKEFGILDVLFAFRMQVFLLILSALMQSASAFFRSFKRLLISSSCWLSFSRCCRIAAIRLLSCSILVLPGSYISII